MVRDEMTENQGDELGRERIAPRNNCLHQFTLYHLTKTLLHTLQLQFYGETVTEKIRMAPLLQGVDSCHYKVALKGVISPSH